MLKMLVAAQTYLAGDIAMDNAKLVYRFLKDVIGLTTIKRHTDSFFFIGLPYTRANCPANRLMAIAAISRNIGAQGSPRSEVWGQALRKLEANDPEIIEYNVDDFAWHSGDRITTEDCPEWLLPHGRIWNNLVEQDSPTALSRKRWLAVPLDPVDGVATGHCWFTTVNESGYRNDSFEGLGSLGYPELKAVSALNKVDLIEDAILAIRYARENGITGLTADGYIPLIRHILGEGSLNERREKLLLLYAFSRVVHAMTPREMQFLFDSFLKDLGGKVQFALLPESASPYCHTGRFKTHETVAQLFFDERAVDHFSNKRIKKSNTLGICFPLGSGRRGIINLSSGFSFGSCIPGPTSEEQEELKAILRVKMGRVPIRGRGDEPSLSDYEKEFLYRNRSIPTSGISQSNEPHRYRATRRGEVARDANLFRRKNYSSRYLGPTDRMAYMVLSMGEDIAAENTALYPEYFTNGRESEAYIPSPFQYNPYIDEGLALERMKIDARRRFSEEEFEWCVKPLIEAARIIYPDTTVPRIERELARDAE
jgi:hypothetical protein